VYFEDESTTMYDVEMQVESNPNLPRRSRFYQSMMDSNALEKNESYLKLMASYVIFICPFNIFPDAGYHVYTFQQRAKENTDIILEDGTARIFVCAEGSQDDISDEMKDFLNYLSGKLSSNPLVTQIDDAVKLARHNKKWRDEYMLSRIDIAVLEDEYKDKLQKLSSEKDAIIADKDAAIADKDAAITDLQSTIERLEKELKEIKGISD
jgi:predicted transposase/invertase (TIGR01784 family)